VDHEALQETPRWRKALVLTNNNDKDDRMRNQRQHPRTNMKCRIRIAHPAFGEVFAHTRDLSDGGVYVRHPELVVLQPGAMVTGQVQDLPIPAPELRMVVMRVDAEGVGLQFVRED
jgi:hypothetical protein